MAITVAEMHDPSLDSIIKREKDKARELRSQLDTEQTQRRRSDGEYERRNRRALAAIAALEQALADFRTAIRSK